MAEHKPFLTLVKSLHPTLGVIRHLRTGADGVADAGRKHEQERVHIGRALPDKDEPYFVSGIDWAFIQARDGERYYLLLAVTITNAGASSLLQHWRIRLTTPKGSSLEIPTEEPLPHETIPLMEGVTEVRGSDFITCKIHPNGLSGGDSVRGFVMGIIPTDVSLPWHVVLSFQDAFGTTWFTNPYDPADPHPEATCRYHPRSDHVA